MVVYQLCSQQKFHKIRYMASFPRYGHTYQPPFEQSDGQNVTTMVEIVLDTIEHVKFCWL